MNKSPRKTATSRKAQPSTAMAVLPGTVAQVPQAPRDQTIVEKLIEVARDPGIDVVKINALIDANERIMAIGARQQFDDAFAKMQGELPIVSRRGMVTVHKDGQHIRSTAYARDVDITEAVRPILAKHGFSLRHRNTVVDGLLVVTGILSHRAGHREEDQFQAMKDTGPGRNDIQAWGSARSYGKRYTTIALLNIASEEDDDGGATGEVEDLPAGQTRPAAPRNPPANPKDNESITMGTKQRPGQVQRLWKIIRNSGRSEQSVREWLFGKYGYDSTRNIKRKDYDAVCAAIQAKGELPA